MSRGLNGALDVVPSAASAAAGGGLLDAVDLIPNAPAAAGWGVVLDVVPAEAGAVAGGGLIEDDEADDMEDERALRRRR